MSDENLNPADGTGEETKQAVTIEQLDELKKQLEETRKAQSGSDRTVQELRKALEQKEREMQDSEKTWQQKLEEQIGDISSKLQAAEKDKALATQRSAAIELLSAEGLKAPKFLDRLIGDDPEATEALVLEYIEDKKSARLEGRGEFAKENGRKPTSADSSGFGGMTYKEMVSLPQNEFAKIPQDVVDKAMETALK